ncbi:MAG: hypothetical protein CYG59_05110 [Chloroflexi bacterium]|nr:MAG: hypothetical protein CYG59_05110 [Chloroflexota bacterium]
MTIIPADRLKAQRATSATLALLDCAHLHAQVQIRSTIPVGKGMASSTADIVGAIEATANALGHSLAPEQVSAIAIGLEPSDGLMHRGVVAYNHRQGRLIEAFGPPPPMQQLIIDLGDGIDTISFNRRPKDYTPEEQFHLGNSLAMVRDGIWSQDLASIGRAATISARINQRLLPKPELDTVLRIAEQFGAYGTACAHSGTVLSLLFAPTDERGPALARAALDRTFQGRFPVYLTRSVATW